MRRRLRYGLPVSNSCADFLTNTLQDLLPTRECCHQNLDRLYPTNTLGKQKTSREYRNREYRDKKTAFRAIGCRLRAMAALHLSDFAQLHHIYPDKFRLTGGVWGRL